MIINVAGTSGSGKTYLMRNFIKWLGTQGSPLLPQYISGRKPPIGYNIDIGKARFFLLGAYEDADTAGCDTIRDVVQVFDLIRDKAAKVNVIYEGLIVMNHTRGPQLAEEFGDAMVVLQLNTAFATCIASINERRESRGDGKLLKKDNTKGNFVRAANYCTKMRAAGAHVIKVHRDSALETLIDLVVNV